MALEQLEQILILINNKLGKDTPKSVLTSLSLINECKDKNNIEQEKIKIINSLNQTINDLIKTYDINEAYYYKIGLYELIDTLIKQKKDFEFTPELIRKGDQYIKSIGFQLLKLLLKRLGIKISEQDYPNFEFQPYRKRNSFIYNVEKKTITIAINSEKIKDGSTYGEELAHYIRLKLNPIEEKGEYEALTSEFFGFLGRRLLFNALSKNTQVYFFPDGEPTLGEFTKSKILKKIKMIKGLSQDYDRRKSLLIHHRGYQFASRVDLSKIHNWAKLFSMPDKEIRRRFFRPDPDYSDL